MGGLFQSQVHRAYISVGDKINKPIFSPCRSHVASTVDDAELLLTYRKADYAENQYMFFVIFEAFPHTPEFICVEFSVHPPPCSSTISQSELPNLEFDEDSDQRPEGVNFYDNYYDYAYHNSDSDSAPEP